MIKRIAIIFLAVTLCVSGIPFSVIAEEGSAAVGLETIFEEDFESYGKEIFAASTKMTDFFTCSANSIGDGFIKVAKNGEGNWALRSYVFTEVHNTTPLVGAYEFSLDVIDAKGSYSSGVFVRGVKMKPAFYESDGHPHASMSQSGLLIYPRPDELRVNVKTYDENWTENSAYLQNNVQSFALPGGVTYPYNLRVFDSGSEIFIYVNDTLMCRIALSSPGKTYEKHESDAGYFGTATVYDGKGEELACYADTLLCSDNVLFGWATRSSEMLVDNVRVKIGQVQRTILAIEKIPSPIHVANLQTAKELVNAARSLYDSLGDDKGLVGNYEKLTKAESAIKGVEETLEVNWPDPTYSEMETTDEDTAEGSLKYTVSEDGATVTISYKVNGETLSYTVPNNENYLFGGYAGTDDLGRTLFDSNTVGSYGSGKERYVGLFYFLCHGAHPENGKLVDLQKILDEYGPEIAGAADNGLYPEGCTFWFAEPLYGYYYLNDAYVMRKHAELLTIAGVDFLYFDVTNGPTYTDNAIQLMSILHGLNEQGFDAPQVVFYTNGTYSETVIRELYRDIYEPELYPDTWFRLNGKPAIVGPTDFDMDGFFTVKRTQWPTNESQTNAWPWMDFYWPQREFASGYDYDGSAISVSVAQHSGTVVFSDSSLYGSILNRGRSYSNPNNFIHDYPKMLQDYRKTLRSSYEAWQADQSLTLQGINFQQQFDTAVASDAMYILITGWNEWMVGNNAAAHNYRKPYYFTDCASMEFSRDCEMMRGGYFDNYYFQMVFNIQRLKGTAPIIVQDSRKPINVTGEFDQWNDVTVTYKDPENDMIDRGHKGYGNIYYENTSGRNDILQAKVTSDSKNVYFYVKTAHDISMYDTGSSWMQIYVNTDRKDTGWYGYDFIVNHKAKDEFTTTVAKYNGTDGAYGFEAAGEVSYRVKGQEMMIAVPLEMLNVEGYKEINVEFKIADSRTVYDEMEDFYCDGDAAPLGRMNYVYQNYIPGVSEITYPERETEPVTDAQTENGVEQTTADERETTDPNNGKKGCRSAVCGALLLPLIASAAALIVWKKKDILEALSRES